MDTLPETNIDPPEKEVPIENHPICRGYFSFGEGRCKKIVMNRIS